MNWVEQMSADALAVAMPGRELDPDETPRLEVEWDEGFHYSSYTYEDPSFKITVWIDGPDGSTYVREYSNDDAREFFHELMQKGSERIGL